MKTKLKLIKKIDHQGSASPVKVEATADPKQWSMSVKSWVKEFKEDRRDGSANAFDRLFGDSTP